MVLLGRVLTWVDFVEKERREGREEEEGGFIGDGGQVYDVVG